MLHIIIDLTLELSVTAQAKNRLPLVIYININAAIKIAMPYIVVLMRT